MSETQFRRATPVLRAANYARARDFYCDRLGFEIAEEGGDPPRFGIFERGGAIVFVDSWNGGPGERDDSTWSVYFHVEELVEWAAALRSAGVEIVREVERTAYGMREVEVLDPDGNRLCFGEDAEPAAAE